MRATVMSRDETGNESDEPKYVTHRALNFTDNRAAEIANAPHHGRCQSVTEVHGSTVEKVHIQHGDALNVLSARYRRAALSPVHRTDVPIFPSGKMNSARVHPSRYYINGFQNRGTSISTGENVRTECPLSV